MRRNGLRSTYDEETAYPRREFVSLTPPDWTARANCRNAVNPDTFVPDEPATANDPAPFACGGCPVRDACLASGLETGSEGWWGGQYLAHSEPNLYDTFAELYAEGISDAAIGKSTGRSRAVVAYWRQKEGIPAHSLPAHSMTDTDGVRLCRYGHRREGQNQMPGAGWRKCRTCYDSSQGRNQLRRAVA